MLKENTLITNFQPHFHLRGKAMQVEAILPDGSTQIVSYVGNFNFNWMTNYIYADDAAPVFPKGTVIHVSAWYDNTKANKNNPDPDQWVGYGDRTVDEMAHAWMNVVYLTDAEYKALLAERKAKAAQDDDRRRRSSSEPSRRSVCAAGAARRAAFLCLRAAHAAAQRAARGSSAPASPAPSKAGSTTPTAAARFLVGYFNRNTQQAARRSDRPEQPDRAGRPGPGAADALPARPAVGHVHRHGAEGVHAPTSASRGRSSPTARPPAFRCACTPTTW